MMSTCGQVYTHRIQLDKSDVLLAEVVEDTLIVPYDGWVCLNDIELRGWVATVNIRPE